MKLNLDTLFPFQPTLVETRPNWQGRSKKPQRASVEYQGGIYIAQWEGRRERVFGISPEAALNNLRIMGGA
jgi:hypothetical protein